MSDDEASKAVPKQTHHDIARAWWAGGEYAPSVDPSATLRVVLLPLLSRCNEDGALRLVTRELTLEMELRLEDYQRHMEMREAAVKALSEPLTTGEAAEVERIANMDRWRLRKVRTAIRLLAEFDKRLDAFARYDDQHNVHMTGEVCTETTAITDEELAAAVAAAEAEAQTTFG